VLSLRPSGMPTSSAKSRIGRKCGACVKLMVGRSLQTMMARRSCLFGPIRYAEACAVDEWAGSTPEIIPLDRWLSVWLPGLSRDGRRVAVFPVPTGAGVPVDANRLAADLSEACGQYE